MTLILGAAARDGIVLVADRRTIDRHQGDYRVMDERTVKLRRVSGIWIGQAGSAGVTATLLERCGAMYPRDIPSDAGDNAFSDRVHAIGNLMRSHWFDWFRGAPPADAGSVSLLLAGHDRPSGAQPIARIYDLRSEENFVPILQEDGFSGTGVTLHIAALLHGFVPSAATSDEVESAFRGAFAKTAEISMGIGSAIQVVRLTPENGETNVFDPPNGVTASA